MTSTFSPARKLLTLVFLAGSLAISLPAATIQFQVTPLSQSGSSSFRINYFLNGFDFLANQSFDIQFDPGLFSSLSNGVAGPGFSLQLLQPNSPPQAAGVYSALATLDHPPLTGPFSVDVLFSGPGAPGAQTYFITQFTPQGTFVSTISSGTTVPVSSAVPEPSTVILAALALLLGCAWQTFRNLQRSRFR